jgi:hypothetical protein
MHAVLIHVGQTPNVSPYGMNPIYSDGSFKFVKIYVDPPRSPLDPTYDELGVGDLVPYEYRNLPSFNSPEFETLTYSHVRRGGEGRIYETFDQEGGYLLFFSTLFYKDSKSPVNTQISSKKGVYIVGYFLVEGVYTDDELLSDTKLQRRFRANGQIGRINKNGVRIGADYWISGSSGELLPKAVPLTEPQDPLMWNEFSKKNLTTATGKPLSNYSKAKYNWTLACPSKNLSSLRNWIQDFSGVQI